MSTWLTTRFGLRVPVVSAPMAGVAGGQLAAAVSRAGALGMIGVGANTTPEWIESECRIAAAAGLPFGVGLQAWAVAEAPAQLDAAMTSGAAMVSVNYGPYERYVRPLQRAGFVVATTIGTLQEAREAAESGVDVIIARGSEGGGHGRNFVSTLPLLQSVLETVDTPVLAAGGIGSARGLAAVLAAGAAGAWVGTAFLTCAEGTVSDVERSRLFAAHDTDTVYGQVFDIGARARWPREFGERSVRNKFFDEWVGREDELATDNGALERMARARRDEDYEIACLDAGQGVELLRHKTNAAEVVAEFASAAKLLRTAAEMQP
jgi:nitronate monooxygenase